MSFSACYQVEATYYLSPNFSMFVSRTVAAEVCMEAKTNDVGYSALKQLGKGGKLRFDLA